MRIGALLLALVSLFAPVARGQEVAQSPLRHVVTIKARVPPEARTVRSLGPEREGSGVVIDSSGLILTIGYVILEAMNIEVVDASGKTVAAKLVAYDHPTGFGLIRAGDSLEADAIELGSAKKLDPGEQVLIVSRTSIRAAIRAAYVVSRRTFAGYWEYLIDNAIFTSPPHDDFGGAALVDSTGRLVGVGSLQVPDALPDRRVPGNMFVPIDLLGPILADLMLKGRSLANVRPWLGAHVEELGGRVFVRRVSEGGPAARAGLHPGDLIVGVDGKPVTGLENFYRTVWAFGSPGATIPLNILKGVRVEEVRIVSGDRYDYLRLNPSY